MTSRHGRSRSLFPAILLIVAAGTFAEAQDTAPGLGGSAWRLVRFQGGDGTTLTPDDRAKYTVDFGKDGGVSLRLDCNRGRGTWQTPGPGQLQFGPLALTRASCPPGSLHDHIAKQWSFIRGYVVKDGHLFLSLMADGGIYEFEPNTPGTGGGATTPGAARSLELNYWAAVEIAGEPVTGADPMRGPHLMFQPGGRVAGSDGCNRVTGTYELKGDAITFGLVASTMMACPDIGTADRRFRDALQNASRWAIAGDSLELLDAAGRPLARFEARPAP
jgi:heat shock protein HslJ